MDRPETAWRHLSSVHALLTRNWRTGLILLALFALLALFHQVVLSAVRQGNLRREATALQTAALFRCKAVRERQVRDSCLQRLRAPGPPDVEALRALTIGAPEQLSR